MDRYHNVVRCSIDKSGELTTATTAAVKGSSTLASNCADRKNSILPQLVESMKVQDAMHHQMESEVVPLVASIGELLKSIEDQSTSLGKARQRNAMLRRVLGVAQEAQQHELSAFSGQQAAVRSN